MKTNTILKVLAVLYAVLLTPALLPAQTQKTASETPLSAANSASVTFSEKTLTEIDRIIDQTVAEVLEIQKKELLAQAGRAFARTAAEYQRKAANTEKSRTFWRRAALAEGAVLAAGIAGGIIVYRMRN